MLEKIKSFLILLFIFAGVFVLTAKVAEIIRAPNNPQLTPACTGVSDKTPAELAILENLSVRRQQLEAKEAEISAMLKTVKDAEKQLDEKILALTNLEKSVKMTMSVKQSKDDAKIANLVKIYSNMRAKEAAKLMADIDTQTLAKIIGKMREIKAAAILAELPESKAKEIATAITNLNNSKD